MTHARSTTPVRRLVLVRPASAEAGGVRRLLLLDRDDHLLAGARRPPAAGVRAP